MKYLLTGAHGQLGTSFLSILPAASVVATDHGDLNITDEKMTMKAIGEIRPDVIINCAAYNAVDEAEKDMEGAMKVNAQGPENLARAAEEHGARLVHVSSDYVFSGNLGRPYHEMDETGPLSNYGKSKLEGEHRVLENCPGAIIARTAWLFHVHGKNFLYTVLRLSKEVPELRIVGDQYGSPTFAPHLARAILELLSKGAGGIFHLAGQGGASWYELTLELFRVLGLKIPVRAVTTEEFPRPAARPKYSVLITRQNPRILLPAWQDGVREFAKGLRSDGEPSA